MPALYQITSTAQMSTDQSNRTFRHQIPCALCGRLVVRKAPNRRAHAASHGQDFLLHCLHCHYRNKGSQAAIKFHIRTAHPGAEITFRDLRTDVRYIEKLVKRCFPMSVVRQAGQFYYQQGHLDHHSRLRCLLCDKETRNTPSGRFTHVYRHSDEAVAECGVCPYATRALRYLRRHLASAHLEDDAHPHREGVDRREELQDTLQALHDKCFDGATKRDIYTSASGDTKDVPQSLTQDKSHVKTENCSDLDLKPQIPIGTPFFLSQCTLDSANIGHGPQLHKNHNAYTMWTPPIVPVYFQPLLTVVKKEEPFF